MIYVMSFIWAFEIFAWWWRFQKITDLWRYTESQDDCTHVHDKGYNMKFKLNDVDDFFVSIEKMTNNINKKLYHKRIIFTFFCMASCPSFFIARLNSDLVGEVFAAWFFLIVFLEIFYDKTKINMIDRLFLILRQSEENQIFCDHNLSDEEKVRRIIEKRRRLSCRME